MQTQISPEKPLAAVKTKMLLSLSAVLLILILLIFFLVPAYISSQAGREMILSKINSSVDGQTDFASLSMGWFKGLRLKSISYNDDTGQAFVKIKQIDAKPRYFSILFGNLSFGKTIIDEPQVEIRLKPRPAPERITHNSNSKDITKPVGLPISRIDLVVKDGDLKVTDTYGGTVELADINSKVNLRSGNEKTDFDLNTTVVAEGKQSKIHVSGEGWNLKDVSGSVQVEVNELNLSSLAPLFSLAKLDVQASGEVSADITTKIKGGQIEESLGSITAKDIDIAGSALKGDRLKMNRLDLDVKMNTTKETINIETFKINSDMVNAVIAGVIPKTAKSMADFLEPESKYDLKASFDCNVASVLSQMPHIFKLKEQMVITSGKLEGYFESFTEAKQRKIKGWANLDALAGNIAEKQIALSKPVQAKLQITSDKETVKYELLEISSSFCTVNASGTSKSLEYEASADFTKLQQELGQFIDMGQYTFTGQAVKKGVLSGNKDKFSAVGSAGITNFRVSKPGATAFEPQTDIDFSITVEPPKNIIAVNLMDTRTSFGRIAIKDAVIVTSKDAEKSLSIPVSVNVSLEKIKPFAVMFAGLSGKAQIAGDVQSQVLLTSNKNGYYVKTDSTEIKNLMINTSVQDEPFIQDKVLFTCDAKVNPKDKTFEVVWDLASPKIKIKGDLKKDTKQEQSVLQGKADCEYDWAAVSTVASAFLPTGFNIKGQSQNKFNFESRYPVDKPEKIATNLRTKAKLGFDSAEYMGLNFGSTKVDVQLEDGVLEIAPFTTIVNEGTLSFAGKADLNRDPAFFEIPKPIKIADGIQINDKTTQKLLMYVNPVFANAVNISGVASFDCEKLAIPLKKTAQKELTVIGTIAIDDIQLQSSDLLGQILAASGSGKSSRDITIHPTRFVLENGYLRYDNMQMDVDKKPINFKGVIGLDKSLDMTVVLPYTSRGKTVTVDEEYTGQRLAVSLRGTLDKPQLDVGKLIEEQLKQQIEDVLREKLGDFLK